MSPSKNYKWRQSRDKGIGREEYFSYLLFLEMSLVAPSLCWRNHVVDSILRLLEFRTPYVDDVGQPLKEDALNTLVEVCNPVLEVSVAFQVEAVNLVEMSRQFSRVEEQNIQQPELFPGVRRKLQKCMGKSTSLQQLAKCPCTNQ